jgi:putative phosphoribosyl transferase
LLSTNSAVETTSMTLGIMYFNDRTHAGIELGEELRSYDTNPPVVVLGLPRGGVPVAACVAKALDAELDILTVRKIGAPGHEELACGAVASGGIRVWNSEVLRALELTPEKLAASVRAEEAEIEKRERSIRTGKTPVLEVTGCDVIIVDDGVATGATMRAAIRAVRTRAPRRVTVALPVCPADTCRELEQEEGVEVMCLSCVPASEFGSVGQWYRDFSQVETEECRDILTASREGHAHHRSGDSSTTAPPASHDRCQHQPSVEPSAESPIPYSTRLG